ncbi:acyloxyacyl hydrolase [Parvibaculum sp.]|uniref:acyloxyacyl hydrolase n=1 Tax=Parvibaculum sp. TaxID=2024848 RepID=UPI00320FFB80
MMKGNIVLKSKLLTAAMAATAFMALCAPTQAADWVDELRVGVYDHNTDLFATRHETSNPDINAEVLFKTPTFLEWAWAPRPIIGANINTGNGTSIAYAGLAWDYDFTKSLFVEGTFGGAIHNGETDHETSTKLNLGCRAMFHESASIGYRFDEHSSLMLTVDHMSNASLCDANPGLTDIGVRYGFKF